MPKRKNPTSALLLALALCAVPAAEMLSGIGPENTLVVVNSDSWVSRTVANEYVALRSIPPCNVVYVEGIPSFERITVESFRQDVLTSIFAAVKERGLEGQIDCVAYSSDFPTSVDASQDLGGARPVPVMSPTASLSGLTYLHNFVSTRNPAYLGPNGLSINMYAMRILLRMEDAPWEQAEQMKYMESLKLMTAGLPGIPSPAPASPEDARQNLEKSLAAMTELLGKHPNNFELIYNTACCNARLGKSEQAMALLEKAFAAGWIDWSQTSNDKDLVGIREREDFQKLLARMKEAKIPISQPQPFKSSICWGPDGMPVSNSQQGLSYMLSTMLACTSGRGMSIAESIESLRRSAKADFTAPRGTIYFMKNSDIRSTTREWAFYLAADKLKELGVNAVVDDGILPHKKDDVAGAFVGIADFMWKNSGSTIVPGAICDHLTSCGGMMGEYDGQTPLTEFIRNGAAGASGTVAEPYAMQAKFATAFIYLPYVQGYTLAESYYMSVTGPYQLLIMGDPLCRPWGRKVELWAEGVEEGKVLSGNVLVSPKIKDSILKPFRYSLFIDGRLACEARPADARFVLDSSKYADGFHDVKVSADFAEVPGVVAETSCRMIFANSKNELKAVLTSPKECRLNSFIEIDVAAEKAAQLRIFQNSQIVASAPGPSAKIRIDARGLGLGPVTLVPVAIIGGKNDDKIVGRPIKLDIIPPDLIGPLADFKEKLEPGFIVKAKDKPATVHKIEGGWLAKAGAEKDADFELEGYFTVADDDVFQLQIMPSDTRISSICVSDVNIDWPRREGSTWWFIPVPLAKGMHRLKIKGTAGAALDMDVRFGRSGTKRLDGKYFQHRA